MEEHAEKGVTVAIDRSKIKTVGMPAIEVRPTARLLGTKGRF